MTAARIARVRADVPSYLRTAQVAALFYVSPKTVSRWAKEGKLPFRRTLGGHRRYEEHAIRELAATLVVRPNTDSEYAC